MMQYFHLMTNDDQICDYYILVEIGTYETFGIFLINSVLSNFLSTFNWIALNHFSQNTNYSDFPSKHHYKLPYYNTE